MNSVTENRCISCLQADHTLPPCLLTPHPAQPAHEPATTLTKMSTSTLEGRVALVTGAGSGIGRATCLLLARDGARVVAADINLPAAKETISLLNKPGDHLALALDVQDKSSAVAAVKAAKEKFGAVPSLLVNSAGVCSSTVDEATWDRIIDTNLKGTFLVTQAVTQALLEGPGEARAGAAVVNLSSIAAKSGFRGFPHYAASKGGVSSLTKTCAAELAKEGIRVNCVLPGFIRTPMIGAGNKLIETYVANTPLGRVGEPEEVAELVVFLLSPRSSYMVGACVEISGGMAM